MTIISDVLPQQSTVHQPQRKFLAALFVTILACVDDQIIMRDLSAVNGNVPRAVLLGLLILALINNASFRVLGKNGGF